MPYLLELSFFVVDDCRRSHSVLLCNGIFASGRSAGVSFDTKCDSDVQKGGEVSASSGLCCLNGVNQGNLTSTWVTC